MSMMHSEAGAAGSAANEQIIFPLIIGRPSWAAIARANNPALIEVGDPDSRLVFAFAAFAGMRAGEITRLLAIDLDTYSEHPAILVRGKGNKERRVPMIPILIEEVHYAGIGTQHTGNVIRTVGGVAYRPNYLSSVAGKWLHDVLGSTATLHSLRHWYGTNVARITKDPLFVRDLLGHADLSTTQIYTETTLVDGLERLQGFAARSDSIVGRRHLHAVPDLGGSS